MSKIKVCSILHARHVLVLNPSPAQVLENHSVVISEGVIVDICETKEAKEKYESENEENFDSHVLTAGFINTHTHTPMTLLRGYADDYPLMTWLQEHIWPAEGEFAKEEFCKDGTELAVAEMIRGGTTCFNDMYFYPEVTGVAIEKAGMRALLGCPILMFPTSWASSSEEYMKKTKACIAQFKESSLIGVSIAPHAPYTVTDEQLLEIKALSEEHNTKIHMHVHETEGEVSDAMKASGKSPVQRLNELGMLSERMIAVHMTQMTDEEIKLIADKGVSIAHCPESNMKLASGACPTHECNTNGVNVSIGTDGCASNNDLDMFGEMRAAALLGKLKTMDAAALDATTVLRMATLNGAKALGLEKITGSLEVGKRADVIAVRVDELECVPMYSVISHLVFSADRSSVSDVWVDGKRLMKERNLLTVNVKDVVQKAQNWADKIMAFKEKAAADKAAKSS